MLPPVSAEKHLSWSIIQTERILPLIVELFHFCQTKKGTNFSPRLENAVATSLTGISQSPSLFLFSLNFIYRIVLSESCCQNNDNTGRYKVTLEKGQDAVQLLYSTTQNHPKCNQTHRERILKLLESTLQLSVSVLFTRD